MQSTTDSSSFLTVLGRPLTAHLTPPSLSSHLQDHRGGAELEESSRSHRKLLIPQKPCFSSKAATSTMETDQQRRKRVPEWRLGRRDEVRRRCEGAPTPSARGASVPSGARQSRGTGPQGLCQQGGGVTREGQSARCLPGALQVSEGILLFFSDTDKKPLGGFKQKSDMTWRTCNTSLWGQCGGR